MSVSPTDEKKLLRDPNSPNAIHITIPPRFYLLPGSAVIIGTVIGLTRGSRRASLRFLAENVHRPPKTVQGWYFYNKTKNYKVMLGGLKEGGRDAVRLGVTALGWVGIEEGLERAGWGDVREVGAAVGTAGVFCGLYRLPLRGTIRTVMLGFMIGGSMRIMRWMRSGLITRVEDVVENSE